LKFSAQDVPERGLGSGVTNAQAGLRLRYEFVREIAPYVGVEYHGAFGETRDRLEAAGGDANQTVWVIGLRSWF
jgi:copper resistance protein B